MTSPLTSPLNFTLKAPRISPMGMALAMALVVGGGSPLPAWAQSAASSAKAKAPANAQAAVAGLSPARSNEPVTLNFVNAEIESVTRAISAMINRPIVVDPRVKSMPSAPYRSSRPI
jgi:general secretion pathway protein D